jgi:short-subunit dehydrogenase
LALTAGTAILISLKEGNMKNVIILGASGNIAKHVVDILVKKDGFNLTLFLRDAPPVKKQRCFQEPHH